MLVYPIFRIGGRDDLFTTKIYLRDQIFPMQIPLILGSILLCLYFYKKIKNKKNKAMTSNRKKYTLKLNISKTPLLLFFYYLSLPFLGQEGYYSSRKLVIGGWLWVLLWLGIEGIVLYIVRKEKAPVFHIAMAMLTYPLFRITGKSLPLSWEEPLFSREAFIPIEVIFGLGLGLLIYHFYKSKMTVNKFLEQFSTPLLVFYYISIYLFSMDEFVLARGYHFHGWIWVLPWLGLAVVTLISIRKYKNVLFHSAIGTLVYFPLRVIYSPMKINPRYLGREEIILWQIPLILGSILLCLYFYKKIKNKKNKAMTSPS